MNYDEHVKQTEFRNELLRLTDAGELGQAMYLVRHERFRRMMREMENSVLYGASPRYCVVDEMIGTNIAKQLVRDVVQAELHTPSRRPFYDQYNAKRKW